MQKLQSVVAITSLVFSSLVSADWATLQEDDIFSGGQKAMLVGSVNSDQALIFDCDSKGLSLSFVERSEWQDGMDRPSYELLVKIDKGEVYVIPAKASIRSQKTYQVSTYDRELIVKIINEINKAQSRILIGLHIVETDGKWSGTIPASGSTRETQRFLDACKISPI